jgi:hypothetical protein
MIKELAVQKIISFFVRSIEKENRLYLSSGIDL